MLTVQTVIVFAYFLSLAIPFSLVVGNWLANNDHIFYNFYVPKVKFTEEDELPF